MGIKIWEIEFGIMSRKVVEAKDINEALKKAEEEIKEVVRNEVKVEEPKDVKGFEQEIRNDYAITKIECIAETDE